jgi:hypothetical protein
MQTLVRNEWMISAERSWRRSRRLLLSSQALIDPFDDRAHDAETGAVLTTDPADQGLDAVAQTEPAVGAAVVSGIGVKLGDGNAGDQGTPQQGGEHCGVGHVRCRRKSGDRQAGRRHHEMVFGARLAAIGRVRPGQLPATLGADAATVDHHVPGLCCGFGSRSGHPQEDPVSPSQHRMPRPIGQPTPQC